MKHVYGLKILLRESWSWVGNIIAFCFLVYFSALQSKAHMDSCTRAARGIGNLKVANVRHCQVVRRIGRRGHKTRNDLVILYKLRLALRLLYFGALSLRTILLLLTRLDTRKALGSSVSDQLLCFCPTLCVSDCFPSFAICSTFLCSSAPAIDYHP
jgi:hypothetical protein